MTDSSFVPATGVAGQIDAYQALRRAAGAVADDGHLHGFGLMCERDFPDEERVSQAMVDAWCVRHDAEGANSFADRQASLSRFVGFLSARGLTDAVMPDPPLREPKRFVPHAFTQDELRGLFAALDSFRPRCWTKVGRRTKITLPVFFRLLYSTGMRTSEARLLRSENVDLESGTLLVVEGKGRHERLVAMHESMTALMPEYDVRASALYPERVYFFPNGERGEEPLRSNWVQEWFSWAWSGVSDERATAYQLRHHFATTNINAMVGRGASSIDDLEYLAKALGHTSVDVTAKSYYYAVPALATAMREHAAPSALPEVVRR